MVIIVSVIFFALPLFGAGDVERVLKSSVNPEKGNVGQQFSYTLSIAGRDLEGVKIVLPEKGEYYPALYSDDKKSNQKKK